MEGNSPNYLDKIVMTDIREALEEDFDQIWKIFHQIVSAGETYPIHRNASKKEAYQTWMEQPQKTYVCVEIKKFWGHITLNKIMGEGEVMYVIVVIWSQWKPKEKAWEQ